MKNVYSISRNLFNIYLLFTRVPFVRYFTQELEYYSNADRRLLGLISIDFTDKDFYAAVLSRDELNQYRAENVEASIETIIEARKWIEENMNSDSITLHDNKNDYFDLFAIKVSEKQISPQFKLLNETIGLKAAKDVIKEVSYHYKDIDGNFIEQFQSKNGFDSRLWELYLFCFCREEFFSFKRNSHSPDFIIEKLGHEVAIEAVIVGRKEPRLSINNSLEKTLQEIQEELVNEMPLKFGSPLYDKLKKEYWNLPHVKGKSFVIAIADFHEEMSMTWSFSALTDYLYGIKYSHKYNEEGKLIVIPTQINEFKKKKGGTVPAGFFFQPESENVSAIIFSSTATISKFNRMGKQAGLGSLKSIIIRMGNCYNFEENASKPNQFRYQVDEDCNELWAEGISIFHNPNALIPLEKDLFQSVAHHELKGGLIHSIFPEFFPYNSIDLITTTGDDDKK